MKNWLENFKKSATIWSHTYFHPKLFIFSLLLGLIICSIAGRLAAIQPNLSKSTRLTHYLNPMSYFFPTASQLYARLLADLREDQTLIIVGGNSNFHGAGQDYDQLWTTELQRLLGDKYLVVNCATMGSNGPDLGGVLFRMIQPVHANTKLVFNVYTNNIPSFDDFLTGVPGPFSYVFWDAYYKNLIPYEESFELTVKQTRRGQLDSAEGLELHLGKYLDSYFYATDLWSYIGYEWFFTVWSTFTQGSMFQSRGSYPEQKNERPGFLARIERSGMPMDTLMANTRAHFGGLTTEDANNILSENKDHWDSFRQTYQKNFTPALRENILVAVLWPSPYFIGLLNADEQKQIRFAVPHAVDELHLLGYQAVSLGENFDPEDFETSFHYVESGGNKIAKELALQIQALKPSAPDPEQ